MLTIRHPVHPSEFLQRNLLLEQELREVNSPFAITREYPLVLSPQAAKFSYCMFVDDMVVSHFSIWPRTIYHAKTDQTVPILLVGNVATHKHWQGQGLMKKMFQELTAYAWSNSFQAIILWSDLSSFYQKLGFMSLAREKRFMLSQSLVEAKVSDHFDLSFLTEFTGAYWPDFYNLRLKTTWELQRSKEEFGALLTIPQVYTLAAYHDDDDSTPLAYLCCGKGADMVDVIHEWGALKPHYLVNLISKYMELHNKENLLLLSPYELAKPWQEILQQMSGCNEIDHPMALGLMHPKSRWNLEKLFIWGLDSI